MIVPARRTVRMWLANGDAMDEDEDEDEDEDSLPPSSDKGRPYSWRATGLN